LLGLFCNTARNVLSIAPSFATRAFVVDGQDLDMSSVLAASTGIIG
jgi:hypothetical protein